MKVAHKDSEGFIHSSILSKSNFNGVIGSFLLNIHMLIMNCKRILRVF